MLLRDFEGRCYHSMRRGNPLVIGPTHQRISNVHYECALDSWNIKPFALYAASLKADGRRLLSCQRIVKAV